MNRYFRRLLPLGFLTIALTMIPAPASAKPPKVIPLAIRLNGGLTLTPTDDGRVQVKADMAGAGKHLGLTKAEAVWSASQTSIADLESGVIQEVNYSGSLNATIANGSTVSGTFSGRLFRLASGRIGHESTFVINDGTGNFAGSSGSGSMRGEADTQSLRFQLDINGSLVWNRPPFSRPQVLSKSSFRKKG